MILTTPESYQPRVESPTCLPYSFELYSDIAKQKQVKSRHVLAPCPAWIVADEFQYAKGLNTGVWVTIHYTLAIQQVPAVLHGYGIPIEISPNDLAGPLTALKDHTLEGYDKNDYEAEPHGTCLGDLLVFTKRFKEANKKPQNYPLMNPYHDIVLSHHYSSKCRIQRL